MNNVSRLCSLFMDNRQMSLYTTFKTSPRSQSFLQLSCMFMMYFHITLQTAIINNINNYADSRQQPHVRMPPAVTASTVAQGVAALKDWILAAQGFGCKSSSPPMSQKRCWTSSTVSLFRQVLRTEYRTH